MGKLLILRGEKKVKCWITLINDWSVEKGVKREKLPNWSLFVTLEFLFLGLCNILKYVFITFKKEKPFSRTQLKSVDLRLSARFLVCLYWLHHLGDYLELPPSYREIQLPIFLKKILKFNTQTLVEPHLTTFN